VFIPTKTQMVWPAATVLHEMVFEAPLATGPAATLIALMSAVEYAKVHCAPAA
jgi:hypothetical protein